MILDMLIRMFSTLASLLHQLQEANTFFFSLNAKFISQPSLDDLGAAALPC